jgi:soluble lytic murein transglycosylase-like protein
VLERSFAARSGTNWFAIAKLTFLVALSVAVFSLRLGDVPTPAIMIAHFHLPAPAPVMPSVFQQELAMSPKALLDRWAPFVTEASQRFGVPESWVRAVIARESGGRTMMGENAPITSTAGALGIMQVEPETYEEMRAQYGLGANPYDPHDNIIAGTAYLRWLRERYGYPRMFAAYNDGPGNFDRHLAGSHTLPPETVAYLDTITAELGDAPRSKRSRRRITRAA